MKAVFQELQSAEEFFDFYKVPYKSDFVMIWRFHILKQFRNHLQWEKLLDADPTDTQVWQKQRSLLIHSYHHLMLSPPQQIKQESLGKIKKSGCASCKMKCY